MVIPVNGTIFMLQKRNGQILQSGAVARPSGDILDVVSTASDKDSSDAKMLTTSPVDIHAALLPARRSDESSPGRKGLSGDNPARRGKAGLWSDLEIQELKRLVPASTDPKGKVSWVQVEEAWKRLNLPPRTKAGLSSKWTGLKPKTSTLLDIGDSAPSQEKAKLRKNAKLNSPKIPRVLTPKSSGQRVVNSVAAIDPTHPITPCIDPMSKIISETFEKYLKKARKIGCLPNRRKPPNKVSGKHVHPIVMEVDKLIEQKMNSGKGGGLTWDQLSILVFAGAMTVSKIGNQGSAEKQLRSKEWFQKSNMEAESLRKTIGKATAELSRRKENAEVTPTKQQTKNIRMLKKRYGVEASADITSLVEKLKCRLQLLQSRIALRKADEQRARVRRMPTKLLLRGIEAKDTNETTDVHQIRSFWKNIVGVKKSFNPKNEQLVAWERSMLNVEEEGNLNDRLTPELWQRVVQKSKPWKAHGPDGLQGYWWKVFTHANVALYHLALHHLTTGDPLPQRWITEGRIILIHKSGPRSDPSNFRPIACLNTCYKLLTGFVAAYLDQYVREREILPAEQIALRGGVWGCTHALILDQTMTADAQDQKQRPISVAWIDYAKAFDSVPHSYIKWLFSAVQVPISLRKFLKSLMKKWRVRYEAKNPGGKIERSNYLQIRSGVLQGDSFSPLLFCLAMAPISYAINTVEGRYVTASGKLKGLQTSASHLFYMDDLKLFANSAESLSDQIKIVASVSRAINMKLNVKKCARVHFIPKRLRKEQVQSTEEPTPDGDIVFPTLDGEAVYKYLGIEQKLGLQEAEAWDRVTAKSSEIAQKLWNSDLTFRQKVNVHNTTVIPTLCYVVSCIIKGSGKYLSVLEKGQKLDQMFRNILVKQKARYKASCVDRLYLTAEQGGCGLKSVRDSIEESTIYSWAYLCTKVELKSSLNLFANMANRGKRCVVSDAERVLQSYDIESQIDVTTSTVNLSGAQFDDAKKLARHVVSLIRTANNTRRYEQWQELVLAGRVLRPENNIDVKTSFAWLREGKLSSIAVRNVLAAQEGCLITRAHPTWTGNDRSCRKCGKSMETVEHIVSNCSKWLPNLYIDRHDSVARNIHYKLCQKYDLTPPHYSQKVEPVLGNESVKLYWNQPVQTKTVIRHNKPDIIAFDNVRKTAVIIEVAVSWFTGIKKQIEIKRNRYCVNGNWDDELKLPYPPGDNLLRELQTSGWKVTFLPVVIGTNGELLSNLSDDIQVILGFSKEATEKCIERLQRSAVLGTSRIIKNHLASQRQ